MPNAKGNKAAKRTRKPAAAKKAAPKKAAPQVMLTRRNAIPISTVVVIGVPRNAKSAHNKVSWAAITKALPTTIAKLSALPVFSGVHKAKLVSGPMHVSYLARNNYLIPKGSKVPTK
jgi:hypothetical protein